MAEISESGRKEEEIELDLGLAIGQSFRNPGRPTLMAEESGFPVGEIRRCESMTAYAGNESLATDLKKKREIHALNRQKAKRKQVEKRKKRETRRGTGLDSGSEGEEQNHGRWNKKERIQKATDLNLSNERDSSPPCRPSPIIPMQYSNSPLQYLPITAINRFVFPCVMPSWGPGSGAGNFNPSRDNHFFNQSIGCNVDNGDNKKISDGSPVRSSPVVADNQSCSNEDDGSRSDSKSHSSQSLAEHESNSSINQFDHDASSRRPDDRGVTRSSRKPSVSGDWEVTESNKIMKTPNNGSLSLASMPCVSTMGEGPDSKRIIGFLYRYSKSEVSIVCVCHGKSFSPAEFVKHAGGTEVSNPLRHITVISSAFA